MLLAITLMIIALAGPRWGIDDSPGIIRGRDLVLILDLSKSMEAADMNNPNGRSAGRPDAMPFSIYWKI